MSKADETFTFCVDYQKLIFYVLELLRVAKDVLMRLFFRRIGISLYFTQSSEWYIKTHKEN